MSIKVFCWTISGIIAAVLGRMMVSGFVAAHGWNDPVGGVFILSLVIWAVLSGIFHLAAWRRQPLSLIKENGSLLYLLEKNHEPLFCGVHFADKWTAKKFKITDLFRRYTYLPDSINVSCVVRNYFGEVSGVRYIEVQLEDFNVVFEGNHKRALKVYEDFASAEKRINNLIGEAFEAAVKEGTALTDRNVCTSTDLKALFIYRVQEVLEREMYKFDGRKTIKITTKTTYC
jgi:hypothetical protein